MIIKNNAPRVLKPGGVCFLQKGRNDVREDIAAVLVANPDFLHKVEIGQLEIVTPFDPKKAQELAKNPIKGSPSPVGKLPWAVAVKKIGDMEDVDHLME